MKVSIQRIALENIEMHFFFDQEHEPAIDIAGQKYTSLSPLFLAYPTLSRPKNLSKAAQIINFLATGLDFRLIENIEEFKEDYLQRIESEQMGLVLDGPMISQYGVFDVSAIHPPTIKENFLIFFVKADYTQLPYRVQVSFPPIQEELEVSYELLPHTS